MEDENNIKYVCIKDRKGMIYRCNEKAAEEKVRRYKWVYATKEAWKRQGRKILGEDPR